MCNGTFAEPGLFLHLQKQDDAAPKKVPRAHALTRRKRNRVRF